MTAERRFDVSTANSARAARWRLRKWTLAELAERLSEVRRTEETAAEYDAMPKAERDRAKDGPAFVAGRLRGGRRRKGCVESRSCVVLDADRSDAELMADWRMLVGCAAVCYPTHSSREGALKHRLVVPLARDVTADEYVPLAMRIAETLGLGRFDPTTYQPERLMFFPSASSDAEAGVEAWPAGLAGECELLDPDEWLATYGDWRDAAEWPVQPAGVERRAEKAPDPRSKRGAVGAFCRAYPVEEAIEAFLADAYAPAGHGGRYTYVHGSSVGGLVCYGGLWAYSNHATDPAGGRLCNAFDLVRVHRFGELDEEAPDDAPVTALPSYAAMCEWAAAQETVAVEMARGAAEEAAEDFEEAADAKEAAGDAWKARLAVNSRTGAVEPSAGNLLTIFKEDRGLAGKLRRDVESKAVWAVAEALPWRRVPGGADLWSDEDDASLRLYLETRYGIVAKGKVDDTVSHEASQRPYDPLREKLEALPEWDGVPRLDTLLVDALGAEDCEYVRQVTRKTLAGAVRRALRPGCKWDYMLILEGAQGLGKSSLWRMLAGDAFFTDSMTVKDTEWPKIAGEKMRGKWIVEVAELDGMAKTSVERLKGFLSTQEDSYRAAYARHAATYRRRCVVVGTVNNLDGYLRDATGNRRFWPVRVASKLDRGLLSPGYIEQVWAEARLAEALGEPLYLEGEAERAAEARQREAMETDPRESLIRAYLEAPVPPDMDSWGMEAREAFWDAPGEPEEGFAPRTEVSIPEIWHEALGGVPGRADLRESRQIGAILRKLGWVSTGYMKRTEAYNVVRTFRKNSYNPQRPQDGGDCNRTSSVTASVTKALQRKSAVQTAEKEAL